MNSMNQFFDDVLDVIRLRFKPIEHYLYPWPLILIVLLPHAFLNIAIEQSIVDVFVKVQYSYLYFYLIGLMQVSIYGAIFSFHLFDTFLWVKWRRAISFLSLIFFIDTLSLVFYTTPDTYILASVIQIFSLFIMLNGLKIIYQQSMSTIIFKWIFAFLLFGIVHMYAMHTSVKLNVIDETKYNQLVEQVQSSMFGLKPTK